VAHVVQDVMEFSSKQVANAVERIGEMLGALLGADKQGKPVKELLEQVGAVVANLARGLGNALGWMLAGGGDVPYPVSGPVAQTLLAFYGLPDRGYELLDRAGAAVADLAQTTGGALGAGGSQHQTHKPFAPPVPVAPVPVAPSLPVPVAPGGPAPASSSFLGASTTSADTLQLPFAMLVLFSIALLQGGRLSWLRRESHGPPTALVLAIERPG
jgi:hypothetical protein